MDRWWLDKLQKLIGDRYTIDPIGDDDSVVIWKDSQIVCTIVLVGSVIIMISPKRHKVPRNVDEMNTFIEETVNDMVF